MFLEKASTYGSQHPEDSTTDPFSEDPSCSEFLDDFSHLGQEDISEWFESDLHDPGYEHLDDAGIIEHVLRQSDDLEKDQSENIKDEPDDAVHCINHKTAMNMLDKCITWLHCQPEAMPYNSILLSLKEIVAKKIFFSKTDNHDFIL